MSECNEINGDKLFAPLCNECKNVLSIKINPLNFSVEYKCTYNNNHKSSDNIYFKTFERFYLDGITFKNTIQSSNENKTQNDKYPNDNINNGDNSFNFSFINNKCLTHNFDFNFYCLNCKSNLCLFCIKEDNKHDSHDIENYNDLMPSLNKIKNLKEKMEEKIKHTNLLIEKINNWEREIIKKTEELKQNLKDELSLFSKIIYNYNYYYINNSYYKLFYDIDDYIKNINNEYLIKFNECYDFIKQTEIMNQLFKYLGKKDKKESKCISMKRSFDKIFSDVYNIKRIKDKYYLVDKRKNLRICNYDFNNNSHYYNRQGLSEINEKIYSISISTIENKIFVCLSDNKTVKIFDYELENKMLKLNEEEINDSTSTGINHFYKCIQITNNIFLVSDNKFISIWSNNDEKFTCIKKIEVNATSFDLMLANSEYFISSQPDNKQLILFNNNNYEIIKRISNIDSINSTDVLLKVNDTYILINCLKGIALLYIKTKDIIQYIENFYSKDKKISCDDENNIYILSTKFDCFYNFKIIMAKVINHEIKFIKEYEEISVKKEILDFACLKDNILLLWNDDVYISKEF